MYGDIIDHGLQKQAQSLLQQLRQPFSFPSFEDMQIKALVHSLMAPVVTDTVPSNVEAAKVIRIGEVYNVPVVTGTPEFIELDFPILGPLHNDCQVPEMGADYDHWHIDWRFFPDMLYQVISSAYGRATGGAPEDLALLLMHLLVDAKHSSKPERRALRCQRMHSRFMPTAQPWLSLLEKANEGKKVCDDICPHKGFPLAGAMEDARGRYCPGHGLLWSKKGELVKQT